MTTTRAVIYARFSSDKQRDASIDDQVAACNAYAADHGYDVVGAYCDYAMSGRYDDRPQFLRMIEDAQMGRFDVVLVWMVDRFSRNLENHYYYEHILSQAGVRLESTRENIAGNSVEASCNKVINALVAQMTSQKIAANTKRGMLGKAEKCQYLGNELFGYSHDGDKITLDPIKAPIAREIHQRFLDCVPVTDIIAWLNDIGIRTKRGKPVTKNFVYQVLKHEQYCGVYRWGVRKDEEGNTILDANGEPEPLVYVEDGAPAIVSKGIKQQVLVKLGCKRRPAAEVPYELTGRLFCSKCGNPMHGMIVYNSEKKPYRYYACKNKRRACLGSIRKEPMEHAISNAIRALISDKKLCRALANRYIDWQDLRRTSAGLDAVNAERRAINRKREHLIAQVAEGMSWRDVKPMVDSIDLRLSALDREEDKIKMCSGEFSKREIMDYFKALTDEYGRPDDEILRLFVSSAWICADKVVINLSIADEIASWREIEVALSNKIPGEDDVRLSYKWLPKHDDEL